MRPRLRALVGIVGILVAILAVPPAQAAAGPLFDVKVTWGDTNLKPGGEGQFTIQARNIGDAGAAEEELTITDKLPEGVTVTDITWVGGGFGDLSDFCSGKGTETATCAIPAGKSIVPKLAPAPGFARGPLGFTPEPTGYLPTIFVDVAVGPGTSGLGTNTATIAGGGAASAADVDEVPFSATPSKFGIVPGSYQAEVFGDAYPLGSPARQAGEHPFELRVNFNLNAETRLGAIDGTREILSNGLLRTVETTLPRGWIANPEATPKCDPTDFARFGSVLNATGCPPNTQVGYLNIRVIQGESDHGQGLYFGNNNAFLTRVPLYNLEPPKGAPADLAFNAGGLVQAHIFGALDPAQDYAIKSVVPNITTLMNARGSDVTLWGVPGDPAHDRFRFYTKEQGDGKVIGSPFGGAAIRPFLTNPMDCGFDNGGARIRMDAYQNPDQFTPIEEYSDSLNVEGCEDPRFRFEPDISLQPTSRDAGSPTGLDVHLEVLQRDDTAKEASELYDANGDVQAIATPPMKKAVVTFPEGMTISPSAAQGLETCSAAQIGLGTDNPVSCPDASQYGTLTLHTPILPIDEQPEGWIYIAKQGDNPFHNFLSLYLVIQEPDKGILVKIPGRVDLDPVTGQITTTFDDLPQFPVDDFQLTLKGGVRAALVNPQTCGTKTIRAEFFSWHDPSTPKVFKDSYQVTNNPDGPPCVNSLAERPFKPALEAGTLNNSAGSFSPFLLRLTRTDDDQEFSQLGVSMPQGLIGKLAGVAECSEAGIAQAAGRTGAGQGALEQTNPSCPASSLIGTTQVGAGVGVPLAYVPGKVYMAGPYRGAPLSILVVTPAVVGPYDLGVIAVRTALHIDPETTQVSASSDPFPLIYQGIPVRIRDIRLLLDRDQFTLNPTSCAEKQVAARVTGTGGDMSSTADDTAAELANHFQAADCASLGFGPRLFFRLFGGTKRGAHPKLRAVVRMPEGGANIARAAVSLPRSEFLDQAHIRTVCTRVQFAQDACPKGAIYGHVRAKTPLLDEVLSGPIYLRSSDNLLPDLVGVFRGRVDANLIGRVDSVRGGIRNTFELVPDVPVSWAVFTFQGGNKGLLINSRDLCRGPARAIARLRAHNGRRATLRPKLRNACGKKGKKRRAKRSAHRRRTGRG